MRRKPEFLAADPVRKKRKIWQQIKVTAFSKKMEALQTLQSEICCDTFHQEDMRNGTPYRKHPKRAWRAFVFYTLIIFRIPYDDEAGAAVLLHDVLEEIGIAALVAISGIYGFLVPVYVKLLTRFEGESNAAYFRRVMQTDVSIMIKLCDMIDGFLNMIDEFYAGLDSSSTDRVKKYLRKKARPFVKMIRSRNLSGLKYRDPIMEALADFELICREAEDLLKANNRKSAL